MNFFEPLLNMVAPIVCNVCGIEGAGICTDCQLRIVEPVFSSCYRCNSITKEFSTCTPCSRVSMVRQAWCASLYNEEIALALKGFKYQRKRWLANDLASIVGSALPFLPEAILITSVPPATSRLRQRGFDHAGLLARQLAKANNRNYLALLQRSGQKKQVGASRENRFKQARTAYYARNTYAIEGATVLIVDDVMTTGATLEACAAVLKQAGAERVLSAVVAKEMYKQ